MTVRDGMQTLIDYLRSVTDSGTAEFAVGTVNYFTDDQLQERLDRRRDDFTHILEMRPIMVSGTARYYDYYFPFDNVERAESGTTAWRVEDTTGAVIGTANYTVNYEAGHVRFTNDTGGTVYYLYGRAFDLERAAADVYRTKAAHVANRYDVRTDNHDLKRSQLRAAYLDMARHYERSARPKHVRLVREDVN